MIEAFGNITHPLKCGRKITTSPARYSPRLVSGLGLGATLGAGFRPNFCLKYFFIPATILVSVKRMFYAFI